MKESLFAILFFCVYQMSFAQNILLKNIHVIDVGNGQLIENRDIYVKNGLINDISPSIEINADSIDQIIEGSGRYVMPGMIDAHIHLFQSGGLYARPDALDLSSKRPYEIERKWSFNNAEDILKRYTSKGITTVIDLGGPMYQLPLRDSLDEEIFSAQVLMTGPLISSYLPKELDVEDPPIIKVDSIAQAVELVQKQHQAGADFIKIWYIAFTRQEALDFYNIVEAVCTEAKKQSLPVAIHATDLFTAKLSLLAGANFLVHSIKDVEIDYDFLQLFYNYPAVYCPTLQVSTNYNEVFFEEYSISEKDFEIAPPTTLGSLMDIKHIKFNRDLNYYKNNKSDIKESSLRSDSIQRINLKKILEAGIPIALGTDSGNIGTLHVSSFFRELQLLKEVGLTNIDILKSMTLHAAMAINEQDKIGVIKKGAHANLLILKENPLERIEAIESIDMIIKDGQTIDHRSLVELNPELLVQKQLNAYNAHNLDEYIAIFAEDVKVYNFPNDLLFTGLYEMKKNHQFIKEATYLHSELLKRVVEENTVLDHVSVVFEKGQMPSKFIVRYEISEGKIQEVYYKKVVN